MTGQGLLGMLTVQGFNTCLPIASAHLEIQFAFKFVFRRWT